MALQITSWTFWLFCCIVGFLYYFFTGKYQWVILLIASYLFYWTYSQQLLICLILTTIFTWRVGKLLEQFHEREKEAIKALGKDYPKEQKKEIKEKYTLKRKGIVAVYIILCLSVLIYFKFGEKILEVMNLNDTFSLEIIAPVGISFYTLQIIGYVVDVYRKKQKAEHNLGKLALFISFFPQIIQGPICRFHEMEKELYKVHYFRWENLTFGLQRVLWGYFKKLIIADRAAILVGEVFSNYQQYGSIEIVIASVLYTFQIYCDFSGGIDIALGVAEIFGIKMPENFLRPLFSKDISEYWRRWHTTLGSWFRDYLFYPMSLSKYANRMGRFLSKHAGRWAGKWVPTYVALIILWTCNGVWHGAGIQYLLYGFYYGILMIFSMVFEPAFKRLVGVLHINTTCFSWKLWRVMRTFFITVFGRLLYRSLNVSAFVVMVKKLFTEFNMGVLFDGTIFNLGLDEKEIVVLIIAIMLLLVAELIQRSGSLREKLSQQNLGFRWGILLGAIMCIFVFGWYGGDLQASDFIYYKY